MRAMICEMVVGSPAWAGIDLPLIHLIADDVRFPRVGGDRPSVLPSVPSVNWVPPRGRG